MFKLTAPVPVASGDGLFYARYPNGDAPVGPWAGAGSDTSSGSASLSTGIKLAGGGTDGSVAAGGLTTSGGTGGGTVAIGTPLGANMSAGGGGSFSYENLAWFKNRCREGRGFVQPGSLYTQASLNSAGWPTTAFVAFLWEGQTLPGWATMATSSKPFKCGYIGTGTPTAYGSCTIGNIVLGNGTSTYTTFDLYNVGGAFGYQSSAGASNCFAYQPNYPGTKIDDVSLASSYTPEAIAIYQGAYGMMRFMDGANTNDRGKVQCTSTNRRTPANCQSNQSWNGSTPGPGYPDEWAMYFCKAAGIGFWMNMPHWEDGPNGSAGSWAMAALTSIRDNFLSSGLPVRIEGCGNEIWNTQFAGGIYNDGTLAQLAITAGYATGSGDTQGILQYVAYRYHTLAAMCRTVFGSSFGPGKQVQIVLAMQSGNSGWDYQFPIILQYMQSQYYSGNALAVSADIQQLAHAPYLNLTKPNTNDNSVTAVINDLAAKAASGPLTSNNTEHLGVTAAHFGMTMCAYECDWQVNSEASGNAYIQSALNDSRLATVTQTFYETMLDAGMIFPINRYTVGVAGTADAYAPTDELSANWAALISTGSPSYNGMKAVATENYVPKRNQITKSGDQVLGSNFADLINGTAPGLQGGAYLMNYTAWAHFYCPTAQTRTIVMNVTGTGTTNFELDGVLIATGKTLANGNNTIATNVTLSKGHHWVLIGNGAYQQVTAINYLQFN